MIVRFVNGNVFHNVDSVQFGIQNVTLFNYSVFGDENSRVIGTFLVKDIAWITNA
jgi:hypothetical protein